MSAPTPEPFVLLLRQIETVMRNLEGSPPETDARKEQLRHLRELIGQADQLVFSELEGTLLRLELADAGYRRKDALGVLRRIFEAEQTRRAADPSPAPQPPPTEM